MINLGKKNILGVLIDAVDYEGAVHKIINAANENKPYAVSALAVHGVMTGVMDKVHRFRLNSFDLLTPDGQPVRWALNLLYKLRLPDRVYGPALTLKICEAAAEAGLPVFFYGSQQTVLEALAKNLKLRFPNITIAGIEASKFRRTTQEEQDRIAKRIRDSGAKITFIGLGCPRQEIFAYEYKNLLNMPVIAVGAAFDYHAGFLQEPPMFIQRNGLQWLYRLLQEPRRLWHRYLVLNCYYSGLFLLQLFKLWKPDLNNSEPPNDKLLYG